MIDPVKNLYLVNFAKEEVLELDEEIDRPEYGYSEHSEYGYGYGYGYDYGYDYMYEGGYELEEDRIHIPVTTFPFGTQIKKSTFNDPSSLIALVYDRHIKE